MSNRECESAGKKGGDSKCREPYRVWTDASLEDVRAVDGVGWACVSLGGMRTLLYDVFIGPRRNVSDVLRAIEALTTSPDYSALVEEGVLADE